MNVVLLYISNFAYSNECTLYSNNYHAIPGMSIFTVGCLEDSSFRNRKVGIVELCDYARA